MSRALKIGIIWANPVNKNLGVAALAYSCIGIFEEILRENNINATLLLVGSAGKYKETLQIGERIIEFYNVRGLDYLKPISWAKILLRPTLYKIHKVVNLDVVFDIAEGDSFATIYGLQRFERMLNSKIFFNLLKIRQVMLPQTVGPFAPEKEEVRAFNVMKKLYKVISRDEQSYAYAVKHNGESNNLKSIDVAFFLPFEQSRYPDNFVHVGINVSGLLWSGGYTRNNQFNLKTDYKSLTKRTIEFFLSMKDVKVHLVSHVVPENRIVEDDYHAAVSLNKEYPDTIVAPRFENPIQAKTYISGLNFFIGARMHACIAAFSSGVPVVPMAYSRKFNGLFCETLQYNWIGDLVNKQEDDIFEELKAAYANREVLGKSIKHAHDTIIHVKLQELKHVLKDSLVSLHALN